MTGEPKKEKIARQQMKLSSNMSHAPRASTIITPHASASTSGRAHRGAIGRLVVLIVVAVPIAIASITAYAAKYLDGNPYDPEALDFRLGPFDIYVVRESPTRDLILLAVIGIVLVAVGSVILELLAALRVIHPARRLLAKTVLAAGVDRAPQTIALIPSHNEEHTLPVTVSALRMQKAVPDRIIVVADNCTDGTVAVAVSLGLEVFETRGNTAMKAGGLNQALRELLPTLTAEDKVLVMDADTTLGPRFIKSALDEFEMHPSLSAIGGLFYGESGLGMVGQLQRNEYYRYQLQISRRRGRVFVLTGTASIFRADALADVAQARGTLLPGTFGDVYASDAITEDNEITIALKTLGCVLRSPSDCGVVTELMPDWSALWTQRKRWQRGALENLGQYGIGTATLRYWGQQMGIAYGVIALTSAYLMITIALLAEDRVTWYPFWVLITFVFVIERTATVWRGGWAARLTAAPLVIEIAYSFFLQANFIASLIDFAGDRAKHWGNDSSAGSAVES